jgi:hypothetical protein
MPHKAQKLTLSGGAKDYASAATVARTEGGRHMTSSHQGVDIMWVHL